MRAGQKLRGEGRSSFEFVDLDRLLQSLSLMPSTVFVDLGCGRGNYTIAVAESMGPQGTVFGLDAWREGLEELEERAAARGLDNIKTIHANLNEHIPLEDGTVDVCFMATVLHDLVQDGAGDKALRESARILKPTGALAIVEFKKIEGSPGPPVAIRLSPDEVDALIKQSGFRKDLVTDLGPYHYLLLASPPDDI